jgi:hypothetical protein
MGASVKALPVSPIALSPEQAAASLGMSRASFDRYVRPEVRVVRRGSLILVPVRELEKWVDRNAAVTVEER